MFCSFFDDFHCSLFHCIQRSISNKKRQFLQQRVLGAIVDIAANADRWTMRANKERPRFFPKANHLAVATLSCLVATHCFAPTSQFVTTALSIEKFSTKTLRDPAIIDRAKFLSVTSAAWGTIYVPQAESANRKSNDSSPSSKKSNSIINNNPRYIEENLSMTYGQDKKGNPLSKGILVRRWTGDATPFEFPVKPIQFTKKWPQEWPFRETDFFRSDGNDDAWFYEVPRFVYHTDEPAVASLTQYYRRNIPAKSDVLDLCSSWVSHYPLEFPSTMKSISGVGMNKLELKFNDQLTGGYQTKDLNEDPKLPFSNNSFDAVTCVVSMEYLAEPVEILKEVHRVLRPGGKIILSQSIHCFPSKTIAMVGSPIRLPMRRRYIATN